MVDTIEKPVDSGKTFFDISVNTGQICKGFEAMVSAIFNTPKSRDSPPWISQPQNPAFRRNPMVTCVHIKFCISSDKVTKLNISETF